MRGKNPIPFVVAVDCESAAAVDVSPVGEHSAAVLEIRLPPKFQGCTSGLLLCRRAGQVIYSGAFGIDKNAPLYIDGRKLFVTLWRGLTDGPVLNLQAVGQLANGVTVKTAVSPDILFSESLPDDLLADAPPDLRGKLQEMAVALAGNLDVLSGFSELDSALLWRGEAVGGAPAIATDADIDALFN